jgi:hypothetical protein
MESGKTERMEGEVPMNRQFLVLLLLGVGAIALTWWAGSIHPLLGLAIFVLIGLLLAGLSVGVLIGRITVARDQQIPTDDREPQTDAERSIFRYYGESVESEAYLVALAELRSFAPSKQAAMAT